MSAELPVQPTIWLIDEDPRELGTYTRILKRVLPKAITVQGQEPFAALTGYLPLLADPRTACVITDQRLKVSGVAQYTGIELAEFIRGVNTKLPIYILTNFAEDTDAFAGSEWSVEDIIAKNELTDAQGQKVIAARIVRRLNTYQDILGERSERMRELLSKSADGQLDQSDLQELDGLGLAASSPELAQELGRIHQMEQLIHAHQALLEQYRIFASGQSPKEGQNGK